MSKANVKATIDANIKQNGQQLITGTVMNSVLKQMVDSSADQEELTELALKVGDFAIDVATGILTFGGKHFQLIAIEEEEPTYTGAICGRAVCGIAICGTI